MPICLVTGGAGFIGSHIADALIESGDRVIVVDNLSTGNRLNVDKDAEFIRADILDKKLAENFKDVDTLYHFAADPEVRDSSGSPERSFNTNTVGTFNLLEACRKSSVKHVVLASTSTVYGEPKKIPTAEAHICNPISNYGASKLSCESYLSSYSNTYGIKGTVLRYANIFGERSTHGVIFDFYHKLRKNPKKLEILGDGQQDKSYLYIKDCVSATLVASEKQENQFDVFNVGSREKTTTNKIAQLVASELGFSPKYEYTGGKRGWAGDVPLMLLDIKKLESLGWTAQFSLGVGIKNYLNRLSN